MANFEDLLANQIMQRTGLDKSAQAVSEARRKLQHYVNLLETIARAEMSTTSHGHHYPNGSTNFSVTMGGAIGNTVTAAMGKAGGTISATVKLPYLSSPQKRLRMWKHTPSSSYGYNVVSLYEEGWQHTTDRWEHYPNIYSFEGFHGFQKAVERVAKMAAADGVTVELI